MQKLFKIVIVLAIVFALLIFIIIILNTKFWVQGPNGGISPTKKVKLTYWGTRIPEEVMQQLISEYESVNPNVEIQYLKKSFSTNNEYRNYISDSLRSGKAPDIIRIHASWVPYLNSRMSTSSDIMSETEFKDTFYNVIKPYCFTDKDKVRCLPINYDGLVLVYNKGMFADAGLSTPVTWEDVRDAAKRLTIRDKSGNVVRGGVSLGTTNNVQNSVDIISLMLAQSEIKVPDTLDSERALQALSYYTNFATIDKVWDQNMPESIVAFATEKSAMALVRSTQLEEILRLNPTINIGVTKAPQLPKVGGQTTNIYISSPWVEMVNNGVSKDNQRAAWDFLQWMTYPEQQVKLYNLVADVSPLGEIYANKKANDQLENSPLLGAFVLTADQAFITPFVSDSGNDNLNRSLINLLKLVAKETGSPKYDKVKEFKDLIQTDIQKGF